MYAINICHKNLHSELPLGGNQVLRGTFKVANHVWKVFLKVPQISYMFYKVHSIAMRGPQNVI